MVQHNKSCPACGGQLAFRLGEYECDCGYRQSAARDTKPGPIEASPHDQPLAAQSAPPRQQVPGYGYGARPEPGYDPAPSLDKEKMILIGVFLAKTIVNIFSATLRTPNSGDIIFGPVVDQVGAELLNLGLLALVMFLPIRPLKWVCASLTCCYAMLGLAGLLLSALLMPILGFAVTMMSPLGSGQASTGLALLGWVLALVNIAVQFWLASVLFRDLHKMQIR